MNMSSKGDWPGYFHDNCFFIDHIYDRAAIEERRLDKLWDMRDSDIIVCTFPKSGTLWMLTLLSEMYEDLNWKLPRTERTVRLGHVYEKTDKFVPSLYGQHVREAKKSLKNMPSPRLLINHLHVQHFHSAWKNGLRKCKIIAVTRNPKDVCVSYYHFLRSITFARMDLTWDEFVIAFVEGKVWFGPWLDHVCGWHQYGPEDNVLHLTFEDMKADVKSTIRRISEFLGRPLSESKLDQVIEKSSFETMKGNKEDTRRMIVADEGTFKKGDRYLRRGKVGDWKSHFTVAQNEYFDKHLTEVAEKRGLKIAY